MKHPKTREWSDYVRGLVEPKKMTVLERHLDAGCAPCSQRVKALEAVRGVAAADRRAGPPAYALRSARNVFRLQKLLAASGEPRRELELSFDSFLAPAVAGVRTEPIGERNLVYESPRLRLELQLCSAGAGEPLRIEGQVSSTHEGPVADLPVALLENGRVLSQDMSRRHGEFRLQGGPERGGHLRLLIEEEDLVEIELPASVN